MSDILLSLSSYFKTRYVIIDNNMCRLHYKGSTAILIAFSILVTAKQYFGDPIDCVVPKDSIDTKMLDTYCWIHKTFSVEKAFKGELGQDVAYPGVAPHKAGDKLIYHGYYQWVCFVLFIQAVFFYAPRFIWKMLEGNRVQHLSSGLANPVLETGARNKLVDLVVEYMQDNRKRHKLYFFGLVLVEVLFLANTIAQMYLMDSFLGGEFSKYGWNVLTFSDWHWETRYDPMIRVFPRMTKCTFRMYGTSGDINKLDAVCVLPINIINEKIYVFLWFWFVFLVIATSIWMIYRTATICLPSFRYKLMRNKLKTMDRSILAGVMDSSDIGDWFIMYQVSKNIDPLNMKYFLERYASAIGIPEAQKLISSKEA